MEKKDTKKERKKTPYDVSFFSNIYFTWVTPLIEAGKKNKLTLDMFPGIPQEFHYDNYSRKIKKNLKELSKNQSNKKNSKNKFFMIKLLFYTYRYDMLLLLFLSILYNILVFSVSYIIQKILELPEKIPYEEQQSRFGFLIISMVIIKIVQYLLNPFVFYRMILLGKKTLFSLSSLCLDKTMKISFLEHPEFNIGEIINFGTVDSEQFSDITRYLMMTISAPINIIIGFVYMYMLVGVSLFFGMIVVVFFTSLNLFVVKKGIKYQKNFLKFRGARIKGFTESYNNIRFVKAFCLEDFFLNKINEIRQKEVKNILYYSYRIIFSITNFHITPALMLITIFMSYIYMGNQLTVSVLFTFISVYGNFKFSLIYLPNLFSNFIDLLVSSKRLANFFFTDEMKKPDNKFEEGSETDVLLENAEFFYPDTPVKKDKKDKVVMEEEKKDNKETPLLQEIKEVKENKEEENKKGFNLKIENLKIKKGELVAIIGKIGSGKSTFLKSLLGEILYKENENFTFLVNENLAYVAQKPWIRNATVVDNITLGLPYDEKKYNEAVYFSCLKDDIEILDKKDNTIIGDKGVNLSGGQKVRLSLARSLYMNKDLYLFDDPLSALDINVTSFVFNNCISDYLKDKTRILTTHNLSYINNFDKIIFFDKGEIIYCGDYDGLSRNKKFNEYQDILKETSLTFEENEKEIKEKEKTVKEKKKTKKEDKKEEEKKDIMDAGDIHEINVKKELEEKSSFGFGIVLNYINMGLKWKLAVIVISMSLYGYIYGYSFYFYNQQGKLEPGEFDNGYFFKLFIFINLSAAFLNFFRVYNSYTFGYDISRIINNVIVFRILHSSLNKFIDKNPIGKILNRLSGDMEKVDKFIPMGLSYLVYVFVILVTFLTLTLLFSDWKLIFFFLIFFFFSFRAQRSFSIANIVTTKFDSVTKSPFYSMFSDTVYGNTSLRAFKKQGFFKENMKNIIDRNFRCAMVNEATRYWFSIRISLFSLYFVIPIFIYMYFDDDRNQYAAIILLSLTELLSSIVNLLTHINAMENRFVAFDRLFTYTKLPHEKGSKFLEKEEQKIYSGEQKLDLRAFESTEDAKKFKDWPKEGNVEFKKVCAKYGKESPLILKNIDLKIKGGENIGIIGRTGAGKSTLAKLMLRFLEDIEGEIEIDGVNIFSLDIKLLRSKITYISQESYFFEGSLRENLDPLEKKTDEELIELLKESEMYDKVIINGGLDWVLEQKGENLSFGEKQIFCFIRAIINLKKIIIMDEATSNLDIKSEQVLEYMKDKYFKNKTTFTIAHRLNTIYNADKILILDDGMVKAFRNYEDFDENDKMFFKNYIEDLKKGIIE